MRAPVTRKVPRSVAHRGRHDTHVENTLPAFRSAYASGCDMVEFDVQLSRDGIPVVFHDDDCRRLAGRPDKVFNLDWDELRDFPLSTEKAGSSGRGRSDYRIPSLDEFLAEFGTRPFYLELKVPAEKTADEEYCGRLARACTERVMAVNAHAETFLASFHLGILAFMRKHGLFPKLGGIFEDFDRFRKLGIGFSVADQELDLVSISWEVFLKAFPRNSSAPRSGLATRLKSDSSPFRGSHLSESLRKVWIWDIEGTQKFQQAISMGIAGLVTDDVETLLGLLKTS